ncbi:hypothetical protein SAMN04487981_106317 [Streptomyces sp. cf386]|nr:hypothetical protein SAMN04487981_106317 [Streptomyces sp. cf386]
MRGRERQGLGAVPERVRRLSGPGPERLGPSSVAERPHRPGPTPRRRGPSSAARHSRCPPGPALPRAPACRGPRSGRCASGWADRVGVPRWRAGVGVVRPSRARAWSPGAVPAERAPRGRARRRAGCCRGRGRAGAWGVRRWALRERRRARGPRRTPRHPHRRSQQAEQAQSHPRPKPPLPRCRPHQAERVRSHPRPQRRPRHHHAPQAERARSHPRSQRRPRHRHYRPPRDGEARSPPRAKPRRRPCAQRAAPIRSRRPSHHRGPARRCSPVPWARSGPMRPVPSRSSRPALAPCPPPGPTAPAAEVGSTTSPSRASPRSCSASCSLLTIPRVGRFAIRRIRWDPADRPSFRSPRRRRRRTAIPRLTCRLPGPGSSAGRHRERPGARMPTQLCAVALKFPQETGDLVVLPPPSGTRRQRLPRFVDSAPGRRAGARPTPDSIRFVGRCAEAGSATGGGRGGGGWGGR